MRKSTVFWKGFASSTLMQNRVADKVSQSWTNLRPIEPWIQILVSFNEKNNITWERVQCFEEARKKKLEENCLKSLWPYLTWMSTECQQMLHLELHTADTLLNFNKILTTLPFHYSKNKVKHIQKNLKVYIKIEKVTCTKIHLNALVLKKLSL